MKANSKTSASADAPQFAAIAERFAALAVDLSHGLLYVDVAAQRLHWLHADGVRGLMVWVVPTDPDDPASEPAHGFNPLNKPAEQVICRVFGGTSH